MKNTVGFAPSRVVSKYCSRTLFSHWVQTAKTNEIHVIVKEISLEVLKTLYLFSTNFHENVRFIHISGIQQAICRWIGMCVMPLINNRVKWFELDFLCCYSTKYTVAHLYQTMTIYVQLLSVVEVRACS